MKKIFAIATLMCAFALPAHAAMMDQPANNTDLKAGYCIQVKDILLKDKDDTVGPMAQINASLMEDRERLASYLKFRIFVADVDPLQIQYAKNRAIADFNNIPKLPACVSDPDWWKDSTCVEKQKAHMASIRPLPQAVACNDLSWLPF